MIIGYGAIIGFDVMINVGKKIILTKNQKKQSVKHKTK